MDATTTNDISSQRAAALAKHAEQLRQVELAQDQLAAAHQQLSAIEVELAALASQQKAAMGTTATPTQANPTTAGVSLILNPAAKHFLDGIHSPEQIVEALRAVGIEPQLELTTPEINAYQLANKAVARGDTLVIAAGGDGTIEEVATALIHSPATLGILPLGTMNNLARSLGIPLDLAQAALLLALGATRRLDVGRVITPDDSPAGYFLETAGIGLSALAAPMGEDAEKGRWTDVFNKLGEFFSFTSVGVTIQYDDEEAPRQARTHMVTISNAPLFGNNMLIAPDAKCDDGLLDVAVYEAMELVDLTRYFFGISNGGRVSDPRVHFRRARRVRVTADAPLAVNADLDVLTEQHTWEIEIVPRALSVVVGHGLALSFPVTTGPAAPPLTGPQPLPAAGGR
ncbi:MAG: YegS/Rv2252/BmrU family lipid kinase [Caldilineaceae bacterium]|nr:YegS/Rv2252/BmrU family lipid kinase [Caldilineaceae bacterium]